MPWKTSHASKSTGRSRMSRRKKAGRRPGVHVYLPEGAGDSARRGRPRQAVHAWSRRVSARSCRTSTTLALKCWMNGPSRSRPQTTGTSSFTTWAQIPCRRRSPRNGRALGDAFGAAVSGAVESDNFDRLVLREGMHWRQMVVLRAYAKYMRQMGNTNSFGFIADTLLGNPDVARGLNALFAARFDPSVRKIFGRNARMQRAEPSPPSIEQVATLDADRVLRTFVNLIEATLRTNYYQNKEYLSFKLDPTSIDGLPFPRPMFEIWVYSPRVEGVHLRFGKVARGGLRWSDRREDFRTEILGLVKAQTVKNAVIVPTGAKGGFFAKKLPNPAVDRAAWMAEGIESYKTFIRGSAGHHGQPRDVCGRRKAVCRRRTLSGTTATTPTWWWQRTRERPRSPTPPTGSRPSTDSGWATPSPPAARWATTTRPWASPHAAPGNQSSGTSANLISIPRPKTFTVVGVGDMSGDVFGNGMLLSRHIRLLAAFDHRHIFLDPDPRRRGVLRRAATALRTAPVLLGRLRPVTHQRRRRRLRAPGEVHPGF